MASCRAVGSGGAIAPPIFLDVRKKVVFSTPNISRLVLYAPQKVISTPNIVHLPPGLYIDQRDAFLNLHRFVIEYWDRCFNLLMAKYRAQGHNIS